MPKTRTPAPTPVTSPLSKLRGYVAVGVAGCVLIVSDLVQRTFIAAGARMFRRSRHRILARWIQLMRAVVLTPLRTLGGARFGELPRLPNRPDVLVIMNHQSLLDIPLVVGAFPEGYPRIVTRRRYTRGIPLISHMTRLYQYPSVDPRATVRGDLQELQEAAREGDTPLVIFPEGSRSRTGELGRWKRQGLRLILGARQWDVYVMVADGLWQNGRFSEFADGIANIRCEVDCVGPFRSPEPGEDVEPFMRDMRQHMEDLLARLREASE